MKVMRPVMKGALVGLALRGLTYGMVAINKTVIHTLSEFNAIAVGMAVGLVRWITSTKGDDNDDSEPNES